MPQYQSLHDLHEVRGQCYGPVVIGPVRMSLLLLQYRNLARFCFPQHLTSLKVQAEERCYNTPQGSLGQVRSVRGLSPSDQAAFPWSSLYISHFTWVVVMSRVCGVDNGAGLLIFSRPVQDGAASSMVTSGMADEVGSLMVISGGWEYGRCYMPKLQLGGCWGLYSSGTPLGTPIASM